MGQAIHCDTAQHRNQSVVAEWEFYDVVTAKWSPVCNACKMVLYRLAEQSDEITGLTTAPRRVRQLSQ